MYLVPARFSGNLGRFPVPCPVNSDLWRLVMLRAHGLLKKVPRTHRYLLTEEGRTAIAASLAVRHVSPRQLAAYNARSKTSGPAIVGIGWISQVTRPRS